MRRWLTIEPEQKPPPWKKTSTREASLPGASDHSPGMPPRSTGSSAMSAATGQAEPTSSMRWRRSDQPTGRGLEVSSARIASISVGGMGGVFLDSGAVAAKGEILTVAIAGLKVILPA